MSEIRQFYFMENYETWIYRIPNGKGGEIDVGLSIIDGNG